MDEQILRQIFDELLSSLEPLEAQNAAVLALLKAKGLATEKDLAPFLEQASNTANVRWLAVRVRTEALLANAFKQSEESKAAPEKAQKKAETAPWQEPEGQTQENSRSDDSQTDEAINKKPAQGSADSGVSTKTKTDASDSAKNESVKKQSGKTESEVEGQKHQGEGQESDGKVTPKSQNRSQNQNDQPPIQNPTAPTQPDQTAKPGTPSQPKEVAPKAETGKEEAA